MPQIHCLSVPYTQIRTVRFFIPPFLFLLGEISVLLWICIPIHSIAFHLFRYTLTSLNNVSNFLCSRQTHLFLDWFLGILECRVHALLGWLGSSQAGSGEQVWSLLCWASWLPTSLNLDLRHHFSRPMVESPSVIPNSFVIFTINENNICGYKCRTGIWKGGPHLGKRS